MLCCITLITVLYCLYRFRSIVRERWEICQLAHDYNIKSIYMFDNGVIYSTNSFYHHRSIKITLQTLFCSYLNVKLIYPFSYPPLQSLLWNPNQNQNQNDNNPSYLDSNLFRVMDILNAQDFCLQC